METNKCPKCKGTLKEVPYDLNGKKGSFVICTECGAYYGNIDTALYDAANNLYAKLSDNSEMMKQLITFLEKDGNNQEKH